MDVVNERCAGLDVHKKTVVACVRIPGRDGGGHREKVIRTFRTTMAGLEALRAWLGRYGVTRVAMESTGVYWRPVYTVLEPDFELMLVNARHVKHLPGRKTDVKDCEWLAQLLEHGLLRGSFIPPAAIRDLRDLTRRRKALSRDRSKEVNRVAKTLELANVKLGSVVTDIMGLTGRAILEAMIRGEKDPQVLARLARGSLRRKQKELAEVVPGLLRDHHRFLLSEQLATIDHLTERIRKLDARIEEVTHPFAAALVLLETIPGVARRSAEAILAETGDDMSKFPTAGHFASWARLCPGNHESAGKRSPVSTGRGNQWLRAALSQVAWAAVRSKGSYYRALYHRHKSRGGAKKAIVVVQHSLLSPSGTCSPPARRTRTSGRTTCSAETRSARPATSSTVSASWASMSQSRLPPPSRTPHRPHPGVSQKTPAPSSPSSLTSAAEGTKERATLAGVALRSSSAIPVAHYIHGNHRPS